MVTLNGIDHGDIWQYGQTNRLFQNPFPDLPSGQEPEIKKELWETRIR